MSEIPKGIDPLDKESTLSDSKNKQDELSNEKLQSLSNNDFLKISAENRLQYITKGKTTPNDITKEKLQIQNIEFNFTFKGEFNRQLWLKTTAGQVLPSEVGSVEKKGITYIRTGLKGEFFAANGSRLIINQNDKLKINELRDITDLKNNSNEEVNNYLKNNKDSSQYQDIIKEAADRGFDIGEAIKLFSALIGSFSLISSERKSILENAFTDLDRIKGKNVMISNLSEYKKTEILSKAPEKVKKLIIKYFPEEEYENALLVCNGESGFKTKAINYNTDKHSSIDRGLFQINDYWHSDKYSGLDIYDPEVNIKIAYDIYKEAGNSWRPWYAARKIGLA